MKTRIAVTGGIGSGKSTVLALLKEMGYPVYSCDEIYKTIIKDPSYVAEIQKRFGCVREGKIQLDELSNVVFSDEGKRKELNALAHPRIMEELILQMNEAKGDLVFAEVPLLFEGNYEKLFDKILVVVRMRSDRIAAIEKRDRISKESVLSRIEAQFDYESEDGRLHLKETNAYLLENNKDIPSLKEALSVFLEQCKNDT